MKGRYVIDTITIRKTGLPHERQARRKGHLVDVIWMKLGEPMIYQYVAQQGSHVSTSAAVNIENLVDGSLVVTTRNSIYTFKSEGK
jgi:coenzyme F420-reducing hydrogenase beta subunit